MSHTAIYHVWHTMKARCHSPKAAAYKHYGARGIKVCERWLIFENFLADMGDRPEDHSLDRINTDGDYRPPMDFKSPHQKQETPTGAWLIGVFIWVWRNILRVTLSRQVALIWEPRKIIVLIFRGWTRLQVQPQELGASRTSGKITATPKTQ